jgi:hypothetical protein
MAHAHRDWIRPYTVLSALITAMLATPASGQPRYNAQPGNYGMPEPNSELQQRYNPQTGSYEITTPRAELRYNPNTGGYNYVDPRYGQPRSPNRGVPATPSVPMSPPAYVPPYPNGPYPNAPYPPNYGGPAYPR